MPTPEARQRDAAVDPPPSSAVVIQLATEGSRNCALHADGAVSCWGADFGPAPVRVRGAESIVELGGVGCGRKANGDVLCFQPRDTAHPVSRVALRRPAVELSRGCARLDDGAVACWGRDGVVEQPISGATRIASLRAGLGCALVGAKVTCFAPRRTPTTVTVAHVEELALAGDAFACARQTDGHVVCWGETSRFTAMMPMRNDRVRVPPTRIAEIADAVSLTSADGTICAALRSGQAVCWRGTFDPAPEPEPVPGVTNAVRVTYAADYGDRSDHGCALSADGMVACWGSNAHGELGANVPLFRRTPERVSGIDDAVSVWAGDTWSCALRPGGAVSCWGRLVGNVSLVARDIPTLRGVAELGGHFQLCVRHTDGRIACGVGRADVTAFLALPPAQSMSVLISGCAIADGALYCWGSNRSGQFGNGTLVESPPTSLAAVGVDDAISVATGFSHTCVARKNGEVVAFGEDLAEDGDAAREPRKVTMPAKVPGINDAIQVAAGFHHCCALGRTGHVSCWGSNARGQLGDGTTEHRALPVVVPGLDHVTKIASAHDTTCALAAGRVYCWGDNTRGQLGPANVMPLGPAPVKIEGVNDAIDVSVGGNLTVGGHVCIAGKTGSVACWGSTEHGESGVVSTGYARDPVPVAWPR
jgi:hypothetical protein